MSLTISRMFLMKRILTTSPQVSLPLMQSTISSFTTAAAPAAANTAASQSIPSAAKKVKNVGNPREFLDNLKAKIEKVMIFFNHF